MELGNVMHEMLATKTEFAINCCRGAFQECPGLRLVFRDVGVCMVEVGDGYDPMIHPHIRHHIQQRDNSKSDPSACIPKSKEHQSNADVGG